MCQNGRGAPVQRARNVGALVEERKLQRLLVKVLARQVFFRYALGIGFLALGLILSLAAQRLLPYSEYYFFLAAVVAAGWFGGRGPGLLVAVVAPFTLDYFFLPPLYTLGISAEARPYIVPFLLAAMAAAWMSTARVAAIEAHESHLHDQEKFRRLLSNMPDVTWTTDQFGRMLYISPKVDKVLGFSETEICEGGLAFLLSRTHPEHVGRLQSAAEALFVRREAFDVEFRFQRKDGEWIWVHNRAIGAYEKDGVIQADGVLADISPRKRDEIELREKTAFLEAQINSSIDGILVIDAQDRRLQHNRRIVEMFGIPPELLADVNQIPARDHMLLMFRDAGAVRALIQRLFTNREETSRSEFELTNGGIIDLYSSPVKGPAGEYYGRIWIFRDITDRKRSEIELKSKTALLEALVNSSIDGILVMDESGRRVLINQRLNDFFSIPPEIMSDPSDERPMQHVLQFVKDPESFFARFVYLSEHSTETSRDEIELKDGRVFDRYSAPVLDRDWNYYGRVWSLRDITERRRSEDALRQLSAAVEQSPVTVVITDLAGNITYVNPKFTQVTGYTSEEAVGKNPRILNSGYAAREMFQTLWGSILAGKEWRGEFRNRKKSGELYWEAATITPIFDPSGTITNFLAVKEDITERRAIESELRQAQKLEGIGQLAAGIAHEINTPTQFVTDNLTFLRESCEAVLPLLNRYRVVINERLREASPETAAELDKAEEKCDLEFILAEIPRAIQQSLDGARRVAHIVRAMKEFSHPDSAEKCEADLNQGILSTVTVARNEWKYVAKVETDLDESLPPVSCYAGEINQVVLNLIVNAAHSIRDKLKDGDKGKITIRTRAHGPVAEIAVSDTGMGIPEQIQSRIYEPFFTTKEVGKGTGQGLSFAHSVVVKKHQGKIWFETEVGRGTTFFIELPIREPVSEKESDAQAPALCR
jgi:PAS domain S-box-containing protein